MDDSIQRQRLTVDKHLAETKLRHVEHNLEEVRKQMQWQRTWEEVRIMQEEEKQRLFMLNKTYASISQEREDLSRFEDFEHMQGCYQRVSVLEAESRQNKHDLSILEHDTELQQQVVTQSKKNTQRAHEQLHAAALQLDDLIDNVFLAARLEGEEKNTEEVLTLFNTNHEQFTRTAEALRSEEQELSNEIALQKEELERHFTGRQNMEIHRRMMEQGDEVLTRLHYLNEEYHLILDLKRQQEDTAKKQNMENTLLERAYNEYQKVASEIETINNELYTHHNQTRGMERMELENHFQELKNRHHLLTSAQVLWKRISNDFQHYDRRLQKHNEHRLQIEQLERTIHELAAEAARLTRLSNEKEHTYMLSKNQNIIQLRFGLQEGSACSVCGAIHHPYHSDTMLEQSKLIGDFKTDFELISAEAKAKEQLLLEQRLQLAELKGIYSTEEKELKNLEEQTSSDILEWKNYENLDASFLDCKPSVNQEARQSRLRQLIDVVERDLESAQKTLETFNFHQEQISLLSAKLQKIELSKNELNLRLGELNTGCQVMAGRVEKLQQQIDYATQRYTSTYAYLEPLITIPSWLDKWQENHEIIHNQIQQLLDVWRSINHQIQSEETNLKLLETEHEALLRLISHIENCQTILSENIEQAEVSLLKMRKEHDHITPNSTAQNLYKKLTGAVAEAMQAEAKSAEETTNEIITLEHLRGRNEFYQHYNQQLDNRLAQERSTLDYFISNYNAQHAPIQYAVLEQIFQDGKNWNESRQRIQDIILQRTLSQQNMDRLNSRVLALQSEGGHNLVNNDQAQLTIVDQYETLKEKHRQILLDIARINLLLEN